MAFKMNLSSLLALGFAFARIVTSQTMQQVCDDVMASVCFQQLTDPHTNTTIGIILPPQAPGNSDAAGLGEAIYRISTPLPYGFAGFAFTQDSEISERDDTPPGTIMSTLITAIKTNGPIGVAQRVCIAQNSILSPDGSAYIPISDDKFLISLSEEATYADDDQVTLVFRCQNCPASFKPGSSLTIMRSEHAPIYPTPTAFNATLPLDGAVFSRVTIADESALRSNQWAEYVQTLNV